MPLTAHFHLPQGPRQTPSSSSRLTFHKGLETLSALISARNILPACGEWVTCDRAIEALGRGFTVTVTTATNNINSTSKAGTQAMQQDEGGEREKGKEEEEEEGGTGVLDYLSAIAAACDRIRKAVTNHNKAIRGTVAQLLVVLMRPHDWYGSPDYESCKALLYGEWDLNGIAAIDDRPHAFVVPGMRQEQESNSEWLHRVQLPKLWSNDQLLTESDIEGCKIALIPFRYQTFDAPDRISRDTGDWLSIADVGNQVNEYCVRDRQLGGSHPAGELKRTAKN
ncbi:MAG: hypothetical protein LQ352_006036 [Teloschistes flavicans]|nr:MAG: hypothetical protein LQ352_006036 [Teloschistes flavicans]